MKHHNAYVAAAIALILVGCEVDTTAPNSKEADNSKPWPGAIGAAQSNYLLNGDFAAGSENWSSCGGESTHSVESADMRLTDQGCLYQEFPLSAGEAFTLSCLGRSVSNYSSITLSASNSAYETLESHVAQVSGATYDVSTVSFTAPAQAVRGVVTLYADTSADFDNCVVSPGLVTPEVPIDPPENSGNLLSNSNFEAGMSFWSSCNSTGNVDTGDASARLSAGGCLYQEFPVVTGETYGFRCEGKSEIDYSSLEVIMSDSDYQPLVSSGEQVVTGSNYSQYNVAVAAATGSAQGVAILYAETDAEFDNCEVFAGALVEPPPVDTGNDREELANGDFTEGLTDWSVCGSNPSISQQGIGDSRAVSLDAGGCLYQEFPVTTGSDYTLRCAGLSSEGYTSMDLSMSDASYAQLEFDSQIVSSSVLQDFSVTLTAPPLAKYGVVTLYTDSAALFDNCGINGQTTPVVTTDSDGDGVADSDDAFPDDITESRDTDNDGVGDNADAFPDDASETADSDGDGIGDNSDPFPTDANVPTPVVAFNFDEGSGSRVNDQAGNIDGTIRQFDNSGNAVALSEDFWSTRGFIGGALQMDGYESNSNSLVDVPVSSALSDITDQLSVMAWVKRSAPIANLSILSHDYPSFFFGYHGPQYKVEFFTRTGGQASCYVGSSQLGVWTHMATTYDGRVARLFVNGQEICSRNVSGDLDINTNTATRGGRFTVAGMYGYSNGIADELAGQMDNFRLFDKALSTEDISAYYDRDRAQHNEDNGVSGDSEFDGKTVSIAGFDSGKCVDIAGASLSDGANAVQYNCNASDRQTFDVEKVGDLYRFRARHSGQCLNINGASTAALARLIQWPCMGAANELWSIVDAGEGTYTLRPSHSGLCMNVSGAEQRNNAIILQWPCASDPFAQPDNQRWMLSIAQASADDGKWDGPYAMPTVAVAAVALPDGNVLAFSGADQFDYLLGDGRTYTSVFDTRTNQSSVVVVGNTQHDMFCPGITMLADGRVVVTGGKNEAVTSIYDPDAQSWTRSANMQISRGYHSSALTSDGGIFTVGGSWSGAIGEKGGELYRDGQWRRLTSI